MQPVPCIHCGYNYMRRTTDPEEVRLCNSCEVRENQRNPKGAKKMETIDILVKCPQHVYAEIEETCINQGTNPSDYLIRLHYVEMTKHMGPVGTSPVKDAYWKEEHQEKGGKWKEDKEEKPKSKEKKK